MEVKQDTMVASLEKLRVDIHSLSINNKITKEEYVYLVCLLDDIVRLMGIAMRWTIHLQAEVVRKESRLT